MSIKFHNDISYKYISSITYSKLLILKLCIKDKFIKKKIVNDIWLKQNLMHKNENIYIYIYIYILDEGMKTYN